MPNRLEKSSFRYPLPEELIAEHPKKNRPSSRLLVVKNQDLSHRRFSDITELLHHDDILIVNDTKVIKARLQGEKTTGGKVEILIEKIESMHTALCHVRASRGLSIDHFVMVGEIEVRMLERVMDLYRLRFAMPVSELLAKYGRVPLPTYIGREPAPEDSDRYQTVYARHDGAVAAPTAGLHFDTNLLEMIRYKGVQVHAITLHVGAGTFLPIRTNDLSQHQLHVESYKIPQRTRAALDRRRGRCIAVGTTVVRTLEHAAMTQEDEGETSLFIKPGFQFQVVDALITNFHLPESSLLMMVCAFSGYERTMQAYELAVQRRYRFFSYGDAMWCDRAV